MTTNKILKLFIVNKWNKGACEVPLCLFIALIKKLLLIDRNVIFKSNVKKFSIWFMEVFCETHKIMRKKLVFFDAWEETLSVE